MPKETTDALAKRGAPTAGGGLTVADFKTLLLAVPTVEEDPTESMIAAILASPNPAKWEEVFTSVSFKDAASKRARVHGFRASPSQFEGRVPVFLILDVTWLDTGERGVMTCGSEMAMAQLLNAWRVGALPIDVEIIRKPTPTKAGFHPMRLRYLGAAPAPLGDPAAVVSEQ